MNGYGGVEKDMRKMPLVTVHLEDAEIVWTDLPTKANKQYVMAPVQIAPTKNGVMIRLDVPQGTLLAEVPLASLAKAVQALTPAPAQSTGVPEAKKELKDFSGWDDT